MKKEEDRDQDDDSVMQEVGELRNAGFMSAVK